MSEFLREHNRKLKKKVIDLEEENHQLRAAVKLKDGHIAQLNATTVIQSATDLITDELFAFAKKIAESKSKFSKEARGLLGE